MNFQPEKRNTRFYFHFKPLLVLVLGIFFNFMGLSIVMTVPKVLGMPPETMVSFQPILQVANSVLATMGCIATFLLVFWVMPTRMLAQFTVGLLALLYGAGGLFSPWTGLQLPGALWIYLLALVVSLVLMTTEYGPVNRSATPSADDFWDVLKWLRRP